MFDPTGKSLFAILVLFDGRNAGNQFTQVAFGQINEPFTGIFEGLGELLIIIAPCVNCATLYT